MGRATEEDLDKLHALVVEKITAALQGDDPSPQMIAQAIKMLKENGIDAPAASQRLTGLAEALKDLDLEELADERAQLN